ncbi:MAG: class I SAM-dependent methyltransferase [Candidatus Aerophobetes bacterium]|nr:class I SAM-dependent methyltransferase [Candidatus Aerophobetes bacterium]
MKNFQAKMFNRKASNPKNKPDQILEAIALRPGQSIADIGAGGGYFSLRFAEVVGEKGKVYALDKNPEFLEFIKKSAKEKKLTSIIATLTAEERVDLPEKSVDFIFMRNVTHHISNRVNYFEGLKRFLKPDGRVIILEYNRGRSFSFRGIFGHYVSKETIVGEMEEAGYLLEKEFDFLPEQHFTMYSQP